ncbi:MAG: alanine racemase [Erysipelotrichaceae bacterium]
MYRKTYLSIDLDNIKSNLQYYSNQTNKEIIGVIKANGYGCGDLKIAKLLIDNGINILAVSSLDEALNLRYKGINCDILILGIVDINDLDIVIENNFQIITPSLQWIKSLKNDYHNQLNIHIKYDISMQRLGLTDTKQLEEGLQLLITKNINVIGFMSHYANSDETNNPTNTNLQKTFEKALKQLNYEFKYIHIANSDGALNFNDNYTTHVRIGIGLLGYNNNNLKPAVSLHTHVSNIKLVQKNTPISYGGHYITKDNEYIATIPIGYADGFIRANENRQVYINGKLYPIVGRICMDQCMIKVDETVKFNDQVEIFGKHISLNQMAKELNTINYEILTTQSLRIERKYIENK